jgi:Virulence-associated protein E
MSDDIPPPEYSSWSIEQRNAWQAEQYAKLRASGRLDESAKRAKPEGKSRKTKAKKSNGEAESGANGQAGKIEQEAPASDDSKVIDLASVRRRVEAAGDKAAETLVELIQKVPPEKRDEISLAKIIQFAARKSKIKASTIERRILRDVRATRQRSPLKRNEKGRPLSCLTNCLVWLGPEKERFAFNEMGSVPEIDGRPMTDADIINLMISVENAAGVPIRKEHVRDAAERLCQDRRYHPIRNYLEGLERDAAWDGKPRLSEWSTTYLGVKKTPYSEAIGKMFMIAMVARIFQPGCKADYLVVLEGKQGKIKSTACEVIAGAEYFSDCLPDIATAGKDVSVHLRGKWLIEIAELHAMSRADDKLLKSFLSRKTEKYRPHYARLEVEQPRQGLAIGTTNKQFYLKDETGGRRYWPLKTGQVDVDSLRRDRDQLFAEAILEYRKRTPWWPDPEFEREYIKPEQDARYDEDVWLPIVARELLCRTETEIRVGEIMTDVFGLDDWKKDRAGQNRIMAILEHLGWERGRRTNTGMVWVKVTDK